jgi:aryl sulfotransferase
LADGAEVDDTAPAAGATDSVAGAGPRFVKVHDAYTVTPLGEPLLAGRGGAKGAILIARDPRAVAPSLAHYRRSSVDDAIAFMNDAAAALASMVRSQPDQLRQRLLGWSGHVASWLDQVDIPVHLVRYEDLVADPVATFLAAMEFAGRIVPRSDVERAVDYASFARLQAQEKEKGFGEWRRRGTGEFFFRRGESNAWRCELTRKQIQSIEEANAQTMIRLGYELSLCEDCAETRIWAGEK